MSARFEGRVVLVAGGTGGLGRAVASAFLEEGAMVAVTYRNQPEWEAFKNAASANATRLQGHEVDVTDEAAVRQLVERILAKHGYLDAMVNTVGGYAGGLKLWEMETKLFEQMLNLNLRSGYALSRAAVPAMLKRGRGSIVNVASKAAFDHAAGASAYAVSGDVLPASYAATRFTFLSAMAVSFLSAAFSSSRLCCSNAAQSLRPSNFARVISDRLGPFHFVAAVACGHD